MKFKEADYEVRCGCRSAGECGHNNFSWHKALTDCVDAFAKAMKTKLTLAAVEKGRSGWDDESWTPEMIDAALRSHVEKGDMVDVANLAMFRWNRDEEQEAQKQR